MKTSVRQDDALQTFLETIGKKLRELRRDKGYASHADFAHDHGLPRIQYWRIEKGRANITLKSLHRICRAHGITLEQLFYDINSTKKALPRLKRTRRKA